MNPGSNSIKTLLFDRKKSTFGLIIFFTIFTNNFFVFLFQLLPRSTRYHRCLRCYRSRVVQQCQAVAPGNWSICVRNRQQVAGGQQMWSDHKKGRRLCNCKGMTPLFYSHKKINFRTGFEISSVFFKNIVLCQFFLRSVKRKVRPNKCLLGWHYLALRGFWRRDYGLLTFRFILN